MHNSGKSVRPLWLLVKSEGQLWLFQWKSEAFGFSPEQNCGCISGGECVRPLQVTGEVWGTVVVICSGEAFGFSPEQDCSEFFFLLCVEIKAS